MSSLLFFCADRIVHIGQLAWLKNLPDIFSQCLFRYHQLHGERKPRSHGQSPPLIALLLNQMYTNQQVMIISEKQIATIKGFYVFP